VSLNKTLHASGGEAWVDFSFKRSNDCIEMDLYVSELRYDRDKFLNPEDRDELYIFIINSFHISKIDIDRIISLFGNWIGNRSFGELFIENDSFKDNVIRMQIENSSKYVIASNNKPAFTLEYNKFDYCCFKIVFIVDDTVALRAVNELSIKKNDL
jgi:hypothetical protein